MPDFDLFLLPFLTGLLFAITLPILGCYLRLRNEWLAALAYPHAAAAGALAAHFFALPPTLGGLALAALAGAGKRLERLKGDAAYALILLAGWAAGILITSNQPLAERLGHALFDGQLYFADQTQFFTALLACLLALIALYRLSSRLLLAQLYPDFFRMRGLAAWPIHLGFDLLAALLLALATMIIGVMASFALVFIPPWLAARRAGTWRNGLWIASSFAGLAYALAFFVALYFDQAFGAIFALSLILLGFVVA